MHGLLHAVHRRSPFRGFLWAVCLLGSLAAPAAAQTISDYRSAQSGLWSAPSTWEIFKRGFETVVGSGLNNPYDVAVDPAGGKVYWLDVGAKKIQRANFDGTSVQDVVTGLSDPTGLAVSGSKVYWSDKSIDKVRRANLDGTSAQDVATGLNNPRGLDVDATNGYVYWADEGSNKILRAPIAGGAAQTVVGSGINNPYDVAVDPAGGKVYWLDVGAKKIQRANFDGTSVQDVVIGLSAPAGLDVSGSKVYWSDTSLDVIQRADLNGSNVEDVVLRLSNPRGLDVDATNGYVYWADEGSNKILRADLSGATWIAATIVPAQTDGKTTIRSGHNVTVDNSMSMDEMVVAAGGTLTVAGGKNFLIQDADSTDLYVAGSVVVPGNLEVQGTASSDFASGSSLQIDSQFKCRDNTVCTFTGTVIDNNAAFKFENFAQVTFTDGTIQNDGSFNPRDDAVVTLTGTRLVNVNEVKLETNATLTFNDGAVYEHAQNGGNFPDRTRTTWNAGSTGLVTGVTGSRPGQLEQSFYHFTWNATGQNAAIDLDKKLVGVAGDFTVTNTGTSYLSWVKDKNDALTIGGDYVQTGGTFVYTDGNGTGTMSAAGLRMTGGTLVLSSDDGAPTLSITGDFDLAGGTITETGATSTGVIRFGGSTVQTVTATGTIANSVDLVVANASGVTLASSLDAPRHVTVSSGTFDLAGQSLAVGGNLSVSGALANPAVLTFDGTGTQTVTHTVGTLSVPELVLANTGGTLVLAAGTNVDITTGATLTSGTLNTNGQTFTLKASGGRTATLFANGGTVSGSLRIERYYGLAADGWRMIAAPLAGVNYSALNAVFHTQGGAWATITHGPSTLRTLDFASQATWNELTGADAAFTSGEGYIAYLYAADAGGVAKLPATWTVTGTLSGVTTKSLSFNTTADDSYNYVGNPRPANLDWDAMAAAGTNVGTSYATWDPSLTSGGGMTGYKYYNSAGGIGGAGRYIPPFQGFMVQATGGGAVLPFTTNASANAATPVYFGKRTEARAAAPHLRLHLEGEGLAEAETYLVFDPQATAGADAFDVNRLPPLAAAYATLWSEDAGGRALAFDGRSMASYTETYALRLAVSAGGTYTLSWPVLHDLPDAWRLSLLDRETGERVDLRTRSEYRFTTEARPLPGEGPLHAQTGRYPRPPRFLLQVTDAGRADAGPDGLPLPERSALTANYPNPFADRTTIRYALSETQAVRLVVFDLLGREVARLVDDVLPAGWHEARWAPNGLASGVYLCRLDAGGAVDTRRLVLAR